MGSNSWRGRVTMTTAARAKAEIGRGMRSSFDEQQSDAGTTALRAVREIAHLLTEEVIPRLSHANGDGRTGMNGSGRAASWNFCARLIRPCEHSSGVT